MFFFRFSCQLCTRAFSHSFFAPFVYVVPVRNLLLLSDSVFSVTKMKPDIVYARAQAAILRSSGHSVKEFAKFFNKTVRWEIKWSKRECFEDKSRIERPHVLTNAAQKSIGKSEIQTRQCNKADWQESSKEKYRSFEHNGVEIHGQERMEGF